MIELSYTFGSKRYSISRESIIAAMKTFDRQHHKSLARTGTKYFVWWRGRAYPPKEILRSLKHGPTGQFSGGITTTQVFTDLEFYVGKGKFPKRLSGSNAVLPSLTSLKKRLLRQRWAKLQHNFLAGDGGKYPGVYLFAFSTLDLTGKPVQLNDIFYVGSSCTGLNARLNQFFKGQTKDCCHSAAMRFYRRWRTRATPGQTFYVAVVAIPAEARKEIRTERDLRKMGRIAELEYAMLAHIKKHTGFEPPLNRK